jgi:hypothetical protein
VSIDWHGNLHRFDFASGELIQSTMQESRLAEGLTGLLAALGLGAMAWGLRRAWFSRETI